MTKEDIDKDLKIKIDNILILHRERTNNHSADEAAQIGSMQDTIAATRTGYASFQKDANGRLILRIEKAIRESRKLRVAVEQQPEIEEAARTDITVVLRSAKDNCVDIVQQVKLACLQQLQDLQPLRQPHKDKLDERVTKLMNGWFDVASQAYPLVDNYENEVYQHLTMMKSKSKEAIEIFRDAESRSIRDKHKVERKGLIDDFRKYSREYDLNEGVMFDQFFSTVNITVNELNDKYGYGIPQFIASNLTEMKTILDVSTNEATKDMTLSYPKAPCFDDDTSEQRMELCDILDFSLRKSYDCAQKIERRFVEERRMQLVEIEACSMQTNDDMVKPQVEAVMEMMLSGIEIEADFTKGYDTLTTATETCAIEHTTSLNNFMTEYTSPGLPDSIASSSAQTRAVLELRQKEMDAMEAVSNTNIAEDEKQIDMLLGAGETDIEEWAMLTLNLIENVFTNAEMNYLADLWPDDASTIATGDGSTNLPPIALEDGKYLESVNKLQVLLSMSQEETDTLTDTLAIMREDEELKQEKARIREAKRMEREAKRKEAEEESRRNKPPAEKEDVVKALSKLLPEETRELQEGWFECCSPDGYIYFFHPDTGESLWQLPASLRTPIHDVDEESLRLIGETPREVLESSMVNDPEPEETGLPTDADINYIPPPVLPEDTIKGVVAEALTTTLFGIEVAVDITGIIRKAQNVEEDTPVTAPESDVVAFLTEKDKYNPDFWLEKMRRERDANRDGDDDSVTTVDSLERRISMIAMGTTFDGSVAGSSADSISTSNTSIMMASAGALVAPPGAGMLVKLTMGSEKYGVASSVNNSLTVIDEEIQPAPEETDENDIAMMALGLGSSNASVITADQSMPEIDRVDSGISASTEGFSVEQDMTADNTMSVEQDSVNKWADYNDQSGSVDFDMIRTPRTDAALASPEVQLALYTTYPIYTIHSYTQVHLQTI